MGLQIYNRFLNLQIFYHFFPIFVKTTVMIMKRILVILASVLAAVSLSSCNSEIENPIANDFIGTWDLYQSAITYPDGAVTTYRAPAGEYLIFTENTISIYKEDKIVEHGTFKYENNNIFFDGTIRYRVVSMSRKEMILAQSGLGLLVSEYQFTYHKR